MNVINKTFSWLLTVLVLIQIYLSFVSIYGIINTGVSMKYELGEPLQSNNPALHAVKLDAFHDTLWFFYTWIFFSLLSNSLLLLIIKKFTSFNKGTRNAFFYIVAIIQLIILALAIWLLATPN